MAYSKTHKPAVVADWEVDGYQLTVKRHPLGFLNGYVSWDTNKLPEIPEDHPLRGHIAVHGGITFCKLCDGKQTLGFDCAHLGDIAGGIQDPAQYMDTDAKIRAAHPQPDEDVWETFAQKLILLDKAFKDNNFVHFTRPIDQELVEIHVIQLAGQLKLIHQNLALYKEDPEQAAANVMLGIQEHGLLKNPIGNDAATKRWLDKLRQENLDLDID